MSPIKHRISKKQLFLILLFLLGEISSVLAQKITLEGQILDSLHQGIPNTNLVASPLQQEAESTFSIADNKGTYRLKLEKGISYKIAITSLGFSPLSDTLALNKDTAKNYVLKVSYEELEQVVVEAKMAMIVKDDTITYRTDQFRTGGERKLREVLKKLPGVEVDRKGNVTVNGKKVTKLMVDGKDFFGGDTRLGVNNIPADAVEEVEAIDNYNEVSFMKGLSDSDRMAMNIKLKKDKKKFTFGETKGGGGIKNRYYLHPSIFYYSPNTTLNFIGSLNNINDSPLDFQDVTRFKGGYMSFTDNPIHSGDVGLTQFSGNTALQHKKMQFGAANVTQKLSSHLQLEAYSILAQQTTQSGDEAHTEYLTQEALREDRETRNTHKGFTNFNKIRLRYTPQPSKDLAYDLLANVSNSHLLNNMNSQVGDSLNQILTHLAPHEFDIHQYFRYNTQPSYKHTTEIRAEHQYKKDTRNADWDFDRPVFSTLIPFVEDDEAEGYNFLEDYSSTTQTGRINVKHYWVLNGSNHIYPIAGLYFFDQSYTTTDFQRLHNGHINSFFDSGFDNALNYHLIDPYIGFQYKFKIGEVTFRPGVLYHRYFWKVKQFTEQIAHQNKGVFLPEFKLEYKPSGSRKLEFDYNLKSSFADAEKYANRLSLKSFNRLYRGNENLENTLYHNFSLFYRDFNIGSGINYYLMLNYRRQEKSIQNQTVLNGIDQVSTAFYSRFPENTFSLNGSYNRSWEPLSAGVSIQASTADYPRIINGEKLDYDVNNFTYKFRARTRFKNLPNIEVGLQQSFSQTKNQQFKNSYTALSPYTTLEYNFLNGFTLKADYDYHRTQDHTSGDHQTFQIGNASLFYRGEDSPWGFEIRVDNAFDITSKRRHSVDKFMIYDQQIFIQPRTILFILSYQL